MVALAVPRAKNQHSLLGSWLTAEGRQQRAVIRALAELSDLKTPLRVEAEKTGLSFFTVISLRRDALLIARPRTLRGGLPQDSFVRLTLPNRERRQVRVPILVPHLQMTMSVKHACVCGLPEGFSGTCKRAADRFNTTQFKNLHLQIPALYKTFRIVDLSASGVRIFKGTQGGMLQFEPDSELAPARLRVGDRTAIELESLKPRAAMGNTVGLEVQVQRDGISERLLINLLNRLQLAELSRLQIDRS